MTSGFIQTHAIRICRGKYCPSLQQEWHRWDKIFKSENEPIDNFKADQMFVVGRIIVQGDVMI